LEMEYQTVPKASDSFAPVSAVRLSAIEACDDGEVL
jgi:hypothetical protein